MSATLDRFMSKVEKIPFHTCWEWVGSINAGGYGQFWIDGKHTYAHRISHQLFCGVIPDGLTIDHLCRNKSCVNPDHLEPVTLAENFLRANKGRRMMVCKNGHGRADGNFRSSVGPDGEHDELVCRTCANIRNRAYRKRHIG